MRYERQALVGYELKLWRSAYAGNHSILNEYSIVLLQNPESWYDILQAAKSLE